MILGTMRWAGVGRSIARPGENCRSDRYDVQGDDSGQARISKFARIVSRILATSASGSSRTISRLRP